MSPNIELVRRWYALLPSLGDTDPNDDSEFFDRMVRDYLDEEFELRLPGGYPEGEPVFRSVQLVVGDDLSPLRDYEGDGIAPLDDLPSAGDGYWLVPVVRDSALDS